MSTSHTVRAGETIARIAVRHGFRKWETVWNAHDNEALRKLRRSPEVLQPGDVVVIPDASERVEPAATGARHRFVAARLPEERLILHLEDVEGQPLRSTDYVLKAGERLIEGTTDGEGKLDECIPFGLLEAELTLNERTWHLRIGELDPVVDPDDPRPKSGLVHRLHNLAHHLAVDDVDEQVALRGAVASFWHAAVGRGDKEDDTFALREALLGRHRG